MVLVPVAVEGEALLVLNHEPRMKLRCRVRGHTHRLGCQAPTGGWQAALRSLLVTPLSNSTLSKRCTPTTAFGPPRSAMMRSAASASAARSAPRQGFSFDLTAMTSRCSGLNTLRSRSADEELTVSDWCSLVRVATPQPGFVACHRPPIDPRSGGVVPPPVSAGRRHRRTRGTHHRRGRRQEVDARGPRRQAGRLRGGTGRADVACRALTTTSLCAGSHKRTESTPS
jgi:hypothetical protein